MTRSFFNLPTDNKVEMEQFDFLRSLSGDRELVWDRLLDADRILIVSEAGMGKTYESKAQQERLFAQGKSAFYLELASLANAPLESQLNLAERQRFESWKIAQSERAFFFLDSIDELKLTSASFELTLKQFATALGENLGRACIVLTTRPGTDDREVVRRQLPILEVPRLVVPEELFADVAMRVELPKNAVADADPRSRFVALAPLDEAQMRALATLQGVTDPDRLMAAIEAEHAREYAKRPLDFIELCGDWKAHGRIRGHRDQLETSIGIKLLPRRDRKEPAELSAAKAREGAERLALAALMIRKFTLWHGNDADRGRGDDALDPRAILSDWSDAEVRALLERALFGFATYGRVRFHNRSAIEYLASQRLQGLRGRGLSSRALHRLLFATSPVGFESIRPTMQPVAAWLAVSQNGVRTEVLRRDPSVLLRFGDSGALSPTQRTQALERYVEVYGAGGWRGLHVPALQARRLASAELAPPIQRLWKAGVENPEVREMLLNLIEAGQITACADIAHGVAVNVDLDVRERLSALQALAAVRDPRLPELLDRVASRHADWPAELAGAVVVHLFPGPLSVPQLLGALQGLTYNRREVGGVSRYLPDAILRAALVPASLEAMRVGLAHLIADTCQWDPAAYRLRSGRQDLAGALTRVCELQLRDKVTTPSLSESIALVLQLSKEDDYVDDDSRELRALLAAAPGPVRSAVFWAQDRLLAAKMTGKDASDRLVRTMWAPSMKLDLALDGPWLQAALSNAATPQPQRQVALECLIQLASDGADRLAALNALQPSVADAAEFAEHLQSFIDAIENPTPLPKWAIEHEKHKEERRRKHLKDRASWVQFWRELSNDADARYEPEWAANTACNLAEVMSRDHDGNRYAGWNRGLLERVFDKPKVEHLRELMMERWRKRRPTLRSERPEAERNVYYRSWQVGLAGLYAEAEDPQWARRLDTEEARLAMRYALTAINGLPEWIQALVQAHPEVVLDTLQPELDSELNDTSAQADHSALLQYIAHAGPSVIALFIDPLRAWLTGALAPGVASMHRANKFERAIELLLTHGSAADAEMIKAAALDRIQPGADQDVVLFWLPLLMRLAPAEAVEVIEQRAASIQPAPQSDVTQWFAVLFGHHCNRGAVTEALLASPDLLSQLALLAYRHVRIGDDRQRVGVHSSNARDHAEFARNQLVSALLGAKGPEAWHAKIKFSEDPLVEHFRDRALALAKQGMAEEWDAPMYELADVVSLERSLDISPVTRADMAAMLRDRLDELDDHMREDSSPRELWAMHRDEKLLRQGVAGVLGQLAKGAYSVSQESVTSEEKETDLRLRSSGHNNEGVIELKVGDNDYSFADLKAALKDQLVGKYMAPDARRVGFLLISIAGNKRWKHPDDGHLIEIEEVIGLLRAEADKIVASLGFESLLEVRLLDLRPIDLK